MHLFVILIQNIYRGRRFGGASVGTAPANRECSVGVPQTDVSAPLSDDYLVGVGGDALITCFVLINYLFVSCHIELSI
jgi:hypothetical protein